jgi:tetratricopeptide (TPR) repeat protein
MHSEASLPRDETERVASLFVSGKLRWNETHYEMADALLKKGNVEKAAREYEAVHAFYPDDPFPLTRIGDLFTAMERFAAASKAYRLSLAQSENQLVRLKLGILFLRLGDPENALENLSRSLENDPRSTARLTATQREEAAFYSALALYQTGNREESQRLLEQVLRQNPENRKAERLLREIGGQPQ